METMRRSGGMAVARPRSVVDLPAEGAAGDHDRLLGQDGRLHQLPVGGVKGAHPDQVVEVEPHEAVATDGDRRGAHSRAPRAGASRRAG